MTPDFSLLTTMNYLALGDSYTIGEGVPFEENFPSQTVSLLKRKEIVVKYFQVIAKTGWTTDELASAIEKASIHPPYDIVSLLIGVNNQYRGRSLENYQQEFESLLKKSIEFAGKDVSNVYVLSIPDWGVTPFAEGRDRSKIAQEIDAFNGINKKISAQYKVNYINITPSTREAASDPTLLTGDKLHPSGKEYGKWARMVSEVIR